MIITTKDKYHRYYSYAFNPKEDITAYELAIILMLVDHCAVINGGHILAGDEHWKLVERHFRPY